MKTRLRSVRFSRARFPRSDRRRESGCLARRRKSDHHVRCRGRTADDRFGCRDRRKYGFPMDVLRAQLPSSRDILLAREDCATGRKLAEFYSKQGTTMQRSILLDRRARGRPGYRSAPTQSRLHDHERGQKVVIGRILVNGNEETKSEAILRALRIAARRMLTAADIYTSEQNLYSSDDFRPGRNKTAARRRAAGRERLTDIIVNVEEQAARVPYGGGFSTDLGASGFFDIRHFNLLAGYGRAAPASDGASGSSSSSWIFSTRDSSATASVSRRSRFRRSISVIRRSRDFSARLLIKALRHRPEARCRRQSDR